LRQETTSLLRRGEDDVVVAELVIMERREVRPKHKIMDTQNLQRNWAWEQ
jgi:hypothetical protein